MLYLFKRQWTRTKATVQDDPLCSICSALDFHAIFRDGIRKGHAIPLGHLSDILLKRDKCGLCRLITTHFSPFQSGTDPSAIACTLYTMAHPMRLNHRDVCHRLYIGINDNAYIAIRLLKESDSKIGGPKEFHSQRVGQNVDLSLLKRWIRNCEKQHRETCEMDWWRGGELLPKTVRVVDVIRMALVPAPPKCRYIALSYVWGGAGDAYWTVQANLQQRSVQGGMDVSMMPEIISDTIQLVRQLGEKYVWIDALCIVQDDPNDKAAQIRVMELIYGSSVFTIISVAGTSVRDPLPGVRPGTRDPRQHIAKIQGLRFALPLPECREVVDRSVWNERGWTYQEAMLSRRRMFFTAQQIYFECRRDICSEERPTAVFPLATLGQIIPGSAPASMARESYLRLYMGAIGEFTRRKLSVESDIIDAVAALLRGLAKAFNLARGDYNEAFRFGMLLTGSLDQALLWQPLANAPHSRRVPRDEMREEWPSWSWAAWRGAVAYGGEEIFHDIHLRQGYGYNNVKQSLLEWYIVGDDCQPVRLYVEHRKRIIHESDFNSITDMAYVAPKGDIDPKQLIAEDAPLFPGTLVFRTSHSRFDVTRADDVVGANDVTNYAIYSVLSDIPLPSTLVGRVILPSSIPSPTSHEFVVLSRAMECIGSYDEERLGKRYSGCMLYVMAIQKMRDGKRYERVGVGIIFEQAWLTSKSDEKIIYLG